MKKLFFLYLLALNSCSQTKIKEKNIDIIIEGSQSYKYDLTHEVFTVFYMSKAPTEIMFHLSNEEKSKIIDKYYALNLEQLKKIDSRTGNIYIEDNCMTMPKDYTILRVKTKTISQVIQIDIGCDEYNSNSNVARRIKEFIKYTLNIIQAKPEIKNAPTSDVIYM